MFSSVGTCISSSVQTASVGIQPPTNLLVTNVTASTITISFTPSTSFSVTNYIATTNTGAQAISTGSPITITGLNSNTTYITTIVAVNNNGVFSGDSFSVTTSTINPSLITLSITNFQITDISGSAITSNNPYNVYVFKNTGTNYTISYTLSAATTFYILAVAGGGAAGGDQGGGGGGGGVIVAQVTLPSGTNTITVSVGAGGVNTGNGGNTTLIFNANTSFNITAYGGGRSGSYSVGQAGASNSLGIQICSLTKMRGKYSSPRLPLSDQRAR